MYGISGGSGRIGVISAVSNHFCESCNRFRVTSDGKLRTCLFSDREYDVRSILRDPGHTMQDMLDLFARANAEKPLGYRLLQERDSLSVVDDEIGAPTWAGTLATATAELLRKWRSGQAGPSGLYHPVSYTHLTLPTTPYV